MRPLSLFARFLLVCLVAAACGCSARGSSPQQVFDRAKACSIAGDWVGFYGCIAPARRDAAIGGLIYVAMFTRMGGDSAEAAHTNLMFSHGLTPNPLKPDPTASQGAQLAQWLAPADDRARLFADLVTYTRTSPKAKQPIDPAATLAAVRVTGNVATGRQVAPDGGHRMLRFVKLGGDWFLE